MYVFHRLYLLWLYHSLPTCLSSQPPRFLRVPLGSVFSIFYFKWNEFLWGKKRRYMFYDLFCSSSKIFETGTSNRGWGECMACFSLSNSTLGAEHLAGMLCMTLTRLISTYPPSMEPLPHILGHGKIRALILSMVPDVWQSLCSMSEGWRKKGASSLCHTH